MSFLVCFRVILISIARLCQFHFSFCLCKLLGLIMLTSCFNIHIWIRMLPTPHPLHHILLKISHEMSNCCPFSWFLVLVLFSHLDFWFFFLARFGLKCTNLRQVQTNVFWQTWNFRGYSHHRSNKHHLSLAGTGKPVTYLIVARPSGLCMPLRQPSQSRPGFRWSDDENDGYDESEADE